MEQVIVETCAMLMLDLDTQTYFIYICYGNGKRNY